MDLSYFFAGTQSKEETSSAILATLLSHDDAFRRSFLAMVTCAPPLDPDREWTVRVEDGRTGFRRFDVTLESDRTIVVIENKLSQGAKRVGQLLEYYEAVLDEWPSHRAVALYLAPHASWGADEVVEVQHAIADRPVAELGPDWAQALSWTDIATIVRTMPSPVSWFPTSGIAEVEKAIIAAAKKVDRDWDDGEFLEAAGTRGPSALLVARRSVEWRIGRNLEPDYGRGATGPMYLTLPQRSGPPIRVVKVYSPEASVNVSYRKLALASPFDIVEMRIELIHRLNAIPGTATIKDEYATESESSYISNEVLARHEALEAFFGVMDWVADLLVAG